MHINAETTPTNDTDYNCRTCLTNHMWSCHILPLVINNLGDGHTHMHKHTCLQMSGTKAISRNQVHASSWSTPGLKGYGSPNCIKALYPPQLIPVQLIPVCVLMPAAGLSSVTSLVHVLSPIPVTMVAGSHLVPSGHWEGKACVYVTCLASAIVDTYIM